MIVVLNFYLLFVFIAYGTGLEAILALFATIPGRLNPLKTRGS